MTRRCIALTGSRRCPHRAAKCMSDLYTCTRHGRIQLAILEDWLSPATRRMLAYARWSTAREGQALVDRRYRRRAA